MTGSMPWWNVGEEISLRDAFGRALCHLAGEREDFVLFDADVAGGTGAKPFIEEHPGRVMQFGIAEQNMMAAAAGFATGGLIPVVSGFAAFLMMRSHEQLRTAVAFGGRNVKVCCSHVGLDVGPDGATAQMLEDLAEVLREVLVEHDQMTRLRLAAQALSAVLLPSFFGKLFHPSKLLTSRRKRRQYVASVVSSLLDHRG